MVAVPLGELDGFSASVAQVVELGPSCFAASDRLYIDHVGRMQREDSFDALVCDDSADREVFVNAPAFACDYRAGEYLRSLFVALFNPAVYLYKITYLEVGELFFEIFTLNGV
jgi:hypothetical protein